MNEIKIKLYKFNELTKDSQEKAIRDHLDFLLSTDDEQLYKNLSFDALTEVVIESILINEYYFYFNGELAECVTYTGDHKKTGTTEFKFKGKTYIL